LHGRDVDGAPCRGIGVGQRSIDRLVRNQVPSTKAWYD
jgi:hypothetical protein